MFFDHKKEGKPRSYISLILALSMILSAILPADFGVLGASSVFGDETESGPALVVEEPVEGEETEQETAPPDIVEDIETEITSAYLDDNDDDGKICGTLTAYSKNEYRITVEYDEKAGIPDGAELTAQEVRPEDYLADTAEALGWTDEDYILYTKFFDITITKDGREIEPLSPVTVKAELMDAQEVTEALQVVHIDDSGATELETSAASEAEVSFETESFSVYGFGTAIHSVMNDSSDFADISIYSYGNVPEFEAENTFVEPPEEGFEPSKAFRFASEQKYWVKADLSENAGLDERESFALYTFVGDKAAKVISEDISADSGLCAVDEEAEGVVLMRDTGLRHLNLEVKPAEDKKVTLDGLMPKEAEAKATDVTDEYGNAIAAYDISILDGKDEYQPTEGKAVTVEISDDRIKSDTNIRLIHIKDNGEEEEITRFEAEDGKIIFEAEGFSVYEIVEGPEPFAGIVEYASTLDDLTEERSKKGFYLYCNSTKKYFTDVVGEIKKGKGNVISEVSNIAEAAIYYIEKIDGKYYIYTFLDGKKYINKKNDNTIELQPEETNIKTAFDVSSAGTDMFYFLCSGTNNTYLTHSNGGEGIRFYNDKNDNTKMKAVFADKVIVPDDFYELDGKSSALVLQYGGTMFANALTADDSTNFTKLTSVTIRSKEGNSYVSRDVLVTDDDADITVWNFIWAEEDKYKLSSDVNGITKYLKLTDSGLTLTAVENEATDFKVTPGTGANAGKISLFADGKYISFTDGTGFAASAASGDAAWFEFVDKTDITSENYVTYTAERVSIGKPVDKDQVIVYTRIWDEDDKKYYLYAVDHDGSLYPCTADGGKLMWIGPTINTLLWDLTVYKNNDGTENGYYELYNPYSQKYIAPQLSDGGQILSDKKIGIQLKGRTDSLYYSDILAWDDDYYAYAGLSATADKTTKTGEINYCSYSNTSTFYFAMLETEETTDYNPVNTIDNNKHGITMKMVDFANRNVMSNFLGTNEGGMGSATQRNIFGTELGDDNYPVTIIKSSTLNGYEQNKSLKALYTSTDTNTVSRKLETVNHLFLENVYNSSGYFEFDSCQNYATLVDESGNYKKHNTDGSYDFTVFKELGSYDSNTGNTRKHGQFFPYDTIVGKNYSTKITNQYDALANPLSEDNPRKGEKLYNLGTNEQSNSNPNCYNGMELEAAFVQTPSGKDAWDHDIIFEFTGDDDFWLYVDDELVIDLGGIHSAVEGNVNFCTGVITIGSSNGNATGNNNIRNYCEEIFKATNPNADKTTIDSFLASVFLDDKNPNTLSIKELFIANYLTRHPEYIGNETAIKAQLKEKHFQPSVNSSDSYGYEDIFEDYSPHHMRIFYMERGAGASNLHMRFNLASVTPGSVLFSKTLSGDNSDDLDFSLVQYPFQIFYALETEDPLAGELVEAKRVGDTTEYWYRLTNTGAQHIAVVYQNSNKSADYAARYTPPNSGSLTYKDVFFLNPSRSVEIHFPSNTIKYRITECGVNTEVYETIKINGQAATGAAPSVEGVLNRKDYSSSEATAEDRATIAFDNKVKDDAIRSLIINKKLYDSNGTTLLTEEDDPTGFKFRLWLSNGTTDELALANMVEYHIVKDGYLCYRDPADRKFKKYTDETYPNGMRQEDYKTYIKSIEEDSTLTDEAKEQKKAEIKDKLVFHTSINGTIDGIPSGYSIAVPNLIIGTRFKVEERAHEIPLGYTLMGYERDSATYIATEDGALNEGYVRASQTPEMTVKNKRGFGLQANKVWSDADYTKSHDPIYMAVYKNDTLVSGTVRQIKDPDTSVRYYFDTLNGDINDYNIYEVSLTDPVVDEEGNVTSYSSITRLNDSDLISLNAVTKSTSETKEFSYTAAYERGTPKISSGKGGGTVNTRTDTVTNTRTGGIALTLYDMHTNAPLANGVFELKKDSGDPIKFTSDSNGRITVLYDFEYNTNYTLTQTASPKTYVGMPNPVVFIINDSNAVTLTTNNAEQWQSQHSADANDPEHLVAYIDIFNKPVSFQAIKTDMENNPLSGAHFALYKGISGIGGTIKDFKPIEGFEDLETGTDGIIPKITAEILNAGTYYLSEVLAPGGYVKLAKDIIFTVTELGNIIYDSNNSDPSVTFEKVEETNSISYTITAPNAKDAVALTVQKTVMGNMGNKAKDFTFTLSVAGAADGAVYKYVKGTADGTIANGATFELKNGEEIVFTLPSNANVTITEQNEDYAASFKLDNNAAQDVKTMTITMDDNHTLLVTNTKNGVLPTGIAGAGIMTFIIGLIAALGAMLIIRKQKRA